MSLELAGEKDFKAQKALEKASMLQNVAIDRVRAAQNDRNAAAEKQARDRS